MSKNNKYFYIEIFRIWKSLNRKIQLEIIFSSLILLFTGLFELTTLLLFVPFLNIISGDNIQSNLLNLNLQPIHICILLIASSLLACLFKLKGLINASNVSAKIGSQIGEILLTRFLLNDDVEEDNSISMLSDISYIEIFVSNVIQPIVVLIGNISSLIFILIGIIYISGMQGLLTIIILLCIYLIISYLLKNRITRLGKSYEALRYDEAKIIQDLTCGKDLIVLDNTEEKLISRWRILDTKLRRTGAEIAVLIGIPRVLIEGVIFTFTALLGLYLFSQNLSGSETLLTLILISISLLKFIPSIQSAYVAFSSIKSRKEMIHKIHESIYINNKIINLNNQNFKKKRDYKNVRKIVFRNVTYNNKLNKNPVFKELNFEASKGDIIGLIGSSGAGKTSLAKIILGLNPNFSGEIYINDGKKNIIADKEILKSIGAYMPQDTYIMNDSISKNILFGLEKNDQLLLDAFNNSIIDFSPHNKIDQKNALEASGGQKQRIGMSRIFYRNKFINILDESTSAIDSNIESEILKNLYRRKREKIIFLISHNFRSLRICNRFLLIENQTIREIDSKKAESLVENWRNNNF